MEREGEGRQGARDRDRGKLEARRRAKTGGKAGWRQGVEQRRLEGQSGGGKVGKVARGAGRREAGGRQEGGSGVAGAGQVGKKPDGRGYGLWVRLPWWAGSGTEGKQGGRDEEEGARGCSRIATCGIVLVA